MREAAVAACNANKARNQMLKEEKAAAAEAARKPTFAGVTQRQRSRGMYLKCRHGRLSGKGDYGPGNAQLL